MTPKTTASSPAQINRAKSIERESKVRPVPVLAMRNGSPLVTQRRFNKARAEEYAAHFDPDKFGIPIVNHKHGSYWILDGQHRIAALKIWYGSGDPGAIDCEVYEDLPDNEVADIFLGRADAKPIPVFDKFFVACTAQHEREVIIKRTVEEQQLKVSASKDTKCVGAISAISAVYDRAGANVLGASLRIVRDAYDGDARSFDGLVIQGLGLVINRHNGTTQERHFVDRLAHLQHGVRGVLQRAEEQRERTGNPKLHCVAAALIDIYNKGLKNPKLRLPSWWKTLANDEKQQQEHES